MRTIGVLTFAFAARSASANEFDSSRAQAIESELANLLSAPWSFLNSGAEMIESGGKGCCCRSPASQSAKDRSEHMTPCSSTSW